MSACIAFPKWVVPLIITQRCHQFGNDVGTFFVGSQIFILIDFDIRSSEIFIPQYLWPFQDWEGIILINAVILILRLVFTHVTFIRSICNSKVLYSHQCNFCWVQSDHNYKNHGRHFLFFHGYVSASDVPTEMLPGFTEWCWGKYDGVQNIYCEIEERIKIHSWQSSHWWKWSAAWTNWFEVFYMSLLLFHWMIVCHQHIITLCSCLSPDLPGSRSNLS